MFGLSFWRHPFTAEDPLVSKWCNAKFLQICSDDNNGLIYILDGLRMKLEFLEVKINMWFTKSLLVKDKSKNNFTCRVLYGLWSRIFNISALNLEVTWPWDFPAWGEWTSKPVGEGKSRVGGLGLTLEMWLQMPTGSADHINIHDKKRTFLPLVHEIVTRWYVTVCNLEITFGGGWDPCVLSSKDDLLSLLRHHAYL